MPQLLPYYQKNTIEAGIDEAGRGCLAGPVVAAAVILPADFRHPYLNDSKKLTEHQREEAAVAIKAEALAWAVVEVDNHVIDKINILKATYLAMNGAVEKLKIQPTLLLIDGNRFIPGHNIPFLCIVKGDATYASIAAASILAKTHRDALMKEYAVSYPRYGWEKNKGYPTTEHRQAIISFGASPLHRMSFTLYRREEQLKLGF